MAPKAVPSPDLSCELRTAHSTSLPGCSTDVVAKWAEPTADLLPNLLHPQLSPPEAKEAWVILDSSFHLTQLPNPSANPIASILKTKKQNKQKTVTKKQNPSTLHTSTVNPHPATIPSHWDLVIISQLVFLLPPHHLQLFPNTVVRRIIFKCPSSAQNPVQTSISLRVRAQVLVTPPRALLQRCLLPTSCLGLRPPRPITLPEWCSLQHMLFTIYNSPCCCLFFVFPTGWKFHKIRAFCLVCSLLRLDRSSVHVLCSIRIGWIPFSQVALSPISLRIKFPPLRAPKALWGLAPLSHLALQNIARWNHPPPPQVPLPPLAFACVISSVKNALPKRPLWGLTLGVTQITELSPS